MLNLIDNPNECHSCNREFIYEPYFCISCDNQFCMFCTEGEKDIVMCKICYEEQDRTKILKKIQCSKSTKENPHLFYQDLCECGRKIKSCHIHSTKCYICKKTTCDKCKDFCIDHGVTCVTCNIRTYKYTAFKCVFCLDIQCNLCFRGFSGAKSGGISICTKHCTGCFDHPLEFILDMPCLYKDEFYKCNNRPCTKNLYINREKKISATCDYHSFKCFWCKKSFPEFYKKNIKTYRTCPECYLAVRLSIDFLLLYSKQMKVLINNILAHVDT